MSDDTIIFITSRLTAIYLFFVGAAIGSFINVVAFRLPAGRSLLRPSSRCPYCQKPLRGLEIWPIVGWIYARGRCRTCASPISPRYPLVELTVAVLFGAVGFRWPDFWWVDLKWLIFFSVLTAIFLIDLDCMIIPTELVWPTAAAGLLFSAIEGKAADCFLAAVGGYAAFYAIGWLGWYVFRKEAMGGGDVRLAAMMGAFLGSQDLFAALFIAFFIGAALGLALMAANRRWQSGIQIPFGPMMSAGSVIAVFWGDPIVNFYLVRMGLMPGS